ncbi:MAG: VWA domain-containing protein [Gammaproteobacteria bacterium]|nr:VWA domain-containing protein [Gammaproteobacteria bacterium]MCP5136763.1 VWA domain-containing protein [Gammaproteobacteria bacterium]
MQDKRPLAAEDLEPILDVLLETEFSFRNTGIIIDSLLTQSRDRQDYILDWVRRAGGAHVEIAAQFAEHVVTALDTMDQRLMEAWISEAMDAYDREGLRSALEIIRRHEEFLQLSHERHHGAVLDDEMGVLLHFVHGLSGRRLNIAQGDAAYTDTETIHLPHVVADMRSAEDNFQLYKAMVAYQWAQTRFGSFRVPLQEIVEQRADAERFLNLFHACDTLRLEACIRRELPGLYRVMHGLKTELGQHELAPAWQTLAAHLGEPGRHAREIPALIDRHGDDLPEFSPFCFQGVLRPKAVADVTAARLIKEKARFRTVLRQWLDEEQAKRRDERESEAQTESVRQAPDINLADEQRDEFDDAPLELLIDGEPVAPPESMQQMLTSIVQDLGHVPEDYLVPAGPGEYDPSLLQDQELNPDDVWQGSYHEIGAFLLPEWDYRRQSYRKNWCAVRERESPPVHDQFVAETLRKHSGLVRHLRNVFEAIRDEDRLLKRQLDGENVDIDALVEALADKHAGREMSERLFTRMHRADRNIAVLFMVDMSGSTQGWINDAERESLVLLCEALETLGDRYAIYGFSGNTRKRCEIYRVKRFDDAYDQEVRARISGMRPQDYTRMGAAIRHLSNVLNETEAKTRLLITLSDGKPDDFDGYRGEFGIEDTRRALIEARRSGIHPYCITIDEEGKDYLPHLYGPAAFTVVSEVRLLPLKVSDIYQRLTT